MRPTLFRIIVVKQKLNNIPRHFRYVVLRGETMIKFPNQAN